MSDRTYCCLMLWGIILLDDYNAICDALEQEDSNPMCDLRESLVSSEVEFDDVRDGQLSNDLRDRLDAIGIGYRWTWANGIEYPEGFMIRDPDRSETYSYDRCRGKTVIPLTRAKDDTYIERAKFADALSAAATNKPLIVAETSHEYLEAISNHPDLPVISEGSFARAAAA
jgi:hypothetical protein